MDECEPNQDSLVWKQCLIAMFISCTILLTVATNILNMAIIKNNTHISSVTRIFLNSLTVADLCVGIVCEPFGLASVIANQWPLGQPICTVVGCTVNVFCAVSISSLFLISMDRYIAITRPLRYHSILTSERAKKMAAISWVFCLVYMLGCSYVWGPFVEYHDFVYGCTISWNNYNEKVPILTSSLIFVVIPSLTIFFIYSRLFWISFCHSKNIARSDHQAVPTDCPDQIFRRNLISLKDSKALRTFFYVWMAFNFAWGPFVGCNIYTIIEEQDLGPSIEFIITWLALSNSWWNVIIYSTNASFRQTAADMLRRYRYYRTNRRSISRVHCISRQPSSNV
ncbi:beta-2 adrenergic receptor-like [Anneissia japonica]|uniref:beta-2 adrenergic receptor-like n=1 Tax=Anneissia japonica TaxID=1529436 RepID=UPI00142560D4|nr:beta-2 adrenergic receptor-like [Anneissia japonica]